MTVVLLYARQRLLRPHVLGAVVFVSAGALIVGAGAQLSPGMVLSLTALLVFAFRIADDLFDRTRDLLRSPDRVSVRPESIRPLRLAAGALWATAAALCSIARGAASLGLLIVFTLLLAAWYRTRGSRSSWSDRILLSKYPAFVAIAGGIRGALAPRGLRALAVVYFSACVYEWAHDTASPATAGERSAEAVLLAVACTALTFSFGGLR